MVEKFYGNSKTS